MCRVLLISGDLQTWFAWVLKRVWEGCCWLDRIEQFCWPGLAVTLHRAEATTMRTYTTLWILWSGHASPLLNSYTGCVYPAYIVPLTTVFKQLKSGSSVTFLTFSPKAGQCCWCYFLWKWNCRNRFFFYLGQCVGESFTSISSLPAFPLKLMLYLCLCVTAWGLRSM